MRYTYNFGKWEVAINVVVSSKVLCPDGTRGMLAILCHLYEKTGPGQA